MPEPGQAAGCGTLRLNRSDPHFNCGEIMLCLTRRLEEEIVIAGRIRIRVLSVENGRVKLVVDCPRDIPVCRGEVEYLRQETILPADRTLALFIGQQGLKTA